MSFPLFKLSFQEGNFFVFVINNNFVVVFGAEGLVMLRRRLFTKQLLCY